MCINRTNSESFLFELRLRGENRSQNSADKAGRVAGAEVRVVAGKQPTMPSDVTIVPSAAQVFSARPIRTFTQIVSSAPHHRKFRNRRRRGDGDVMTDDLFACSASFSHSSAIFNQRVLSISSLDVSALLRHSSADSWYCSVGLGISVSPRR